MCTKPGERLPSRFQAAGGLALLLLLLALALPAPAQVGGLELYIKNRAFPGETRVMGSRLYAVAEGFLGALDWSWEEEGERLMVWSRPGGGPSLQPSPRLLVVDGCAVEVGQEAFAGRLLLCVEDFALAVGARYRVNEGLGTADYYPAASLAGGAGPRTVTDGRGSQGSPLRTAALSFRVEPAEGEVHSVMRGYAVVTNPSGSTVRDVLLRVEVRDAKGDLRGGFTEVVGTLAAGEEFTWQFPLWTNFEDAPDPRPALLIEHH